MNSFIAKPRQIVRGASWYIPLVWGAVTAATSACDFAFSYAIGGVPQTPVPPGGVYSNWSGRCDTNPGNSAPLTLYNCFNVGAFGQIFMASATGALSNFAMPMTCLNPAGGAIQGISAFIYQVNANGVSLPATPIAQVPVDLTSCPTLTSWTSHQFGATDFATIPLNFSGVNLTAGDFYAVTLAPTLFTVAPATGSATSASVAAGDTANYSFTFTPSGSSTFNDTVTFSTSGQPAGSTVTFDPPSIAAGASASTVQMSIQTSATSARLHRSKTYGMLAACVFPITGLCLLGGSKRARYAGMILLAVLGIALVGCGSTGSVRKANTYDVTVIATSGGVSQSTVVTLTVQ